MCQGSYDVQYKYVPDDRVGNEICLLGTTEAATSIDQSGRMVR